MSRANGGMNLSVRAHAPGSCTPFITWRAMDKGLTRDAAQPAFAADGGWSDDEPPRLKRWPLGRRKPRDLRMAQKCPQCGLFNPHSPRTCDCGFDFTGTPREPL